MAYDDANEEFLRRFAERIDEQLGQADQLRDAMAQVSVVHAGVNGAVEVTVDSAGGLSGLHLTEAAMRLAPGDLARAILDCSRMAQAKLAMQLSAAVHGAFGPEPDADTPGYGRPNRLPGPHGS
ncbi:hypothetical protein [Rhizomonospora bruguierae]|uniref:hypothetical protein n=1 Tax=Rhizomonospora bruguierae TaxID=1581705 RepID=UPI001BCDCE16|nr:hypothetical protein [Micromonospora sp. NBRC 107566]